MKDDRGELDLTKQIDNLKQRVEGMELLIDLQQKQLWDQRKVGSKLESANNLLQGYRKVIIELSNKLRRKES
jgi:hypothetical protein